MAGLDQAILETSAIIGEKIAVGRVITFDGTTATYLHRRSADLPPQMGVVVEYTGPDADAARNAAMQAAAMRPRTESGIVSRTRAPLSSGDGRASSTGRHRPHGDLLSRV